METGKIKIFIKQFARFQLPFISAILSILIFTSCDIKSSIEKEIVSIFERDQFSARGSDLTLAVCGWAVQENLKLESVNVKIDYGSGRKSGSGIADISASGKAFRCSGKIFFSYGRYYSGGHGYGSGYEDLNVNFRRESEVADVISEHAAAKQLKPGMKIRAEISVHSEKLPDGSLADFYFIDADDASPVFKITLSGNKKFSPKDFWYQEKKLSSVSNWSGTRFKKGKIYLMVSGGKSGGNYTMVVEEITGSEKLKFR